MDPRRHPPGLTLVDARGVPRQYVRLSDVWAHREQLARRILLPGLAAQLGMRYHEAYHALRCASSGPSPRAAANGRPARFPPRS